MNMKILFFLITLIVIFALAAPAKADLEHRGADNFGYNLVYDIDLDITWYDFSYYAPEYKDAVNWADQLSVKVGTIEFTDWRLPLYLEVKNSHSDMPSHSEVEHLYLSELPNYQVLHPWAFPGKWRYFDNLPGGFYWIIQEKEWQGLGVTDVREAPAYNSFDRKPHFIPASGVDRPISDKHTLFYDKNKFLGIAVHPGDIIGSQQKQSE